MSNFKNYEQGQGYRVYKGVLSIEKAREVFVFTTLEICFYVFGKQAEYVVKTYDLNKATQLICDSKLRKELNIPDDMIRRNGNSRESKVLKKSGKTALYFCPYVRDIIQRNPKVHEIFKNMYNDDKLAFSAGLDHLIFKPNMSDESLPILDCIITQKLEATTSLNNPYHYTCLMSLSSLNTEDASMISLLINFDKYFDVIKTLILPNCKYPIGKQKKNSKVTMLEHFNLDLINKELSTIIKSNGGEFSPLEWQKINMTPGDMLIFDCRIPYKIDKNKSQIPILYMPISLRNVNEKWNNSQNRVDLINAIQTGKTGDWGRRIRKNCNLDEYKWRSTESKLVLSKLESCIKIKNFSDQDKQIFGILGY